MIWVSRLEAMSTRPDMIKKSKKNITLLSRMRPPRKLSRFIPLLDRFYMMSIALDISLLSLTGMPLESAYSATLATPSCTATFTDPYLLDGGRRRLQELFL